MACRLLARTIWEPVATTWSGVMARSAARVPTGMKIGVWMTSWGVVRLPARAAPDEDRALISNSNIAALYNPPDG